MNLSPIFNPILLGTLLTLTAALANAEDASQIPKYGDPSKNAWSKATPAERIQLQKEGEALAKEAWMLMYAKSPKEAMVKFNEAWSKHPSNAWCLWGMAAIVSDRCSGMEMEQALPFLNESVALYEEALTLDQSTPPLLNDAARMYTYRGTVEQKLNMKEKSAADFAKAEALFKQVEAIAQRGRLYDAWAELETAKGNEEAAKALKKKAEELNQKGLQ